MPEAAVADGTAVVIEHAEILDQTWGESVDPVTPAIRIEIGDGSYAQRAFTVSVPVDLAAGQMAMGLFVHDDGSLEGMALGGSDESTVTVVTEHFSDWFVSAFDPLALPAEIFTGFQLARDSWQFVNYGSFTNPGGICAGMSASAMWYYLEQYRATETASLFGLFDYPHGAATPGFDDDDADAIRFASMVQRDGRWGSGLANAGDVGPVPEDGYFRTPTVWDWYRDARDAGKDDWQYAAFRYSMFLTGEPQLVLLAQEPRAGGHAVIAYGVTDGSVTAGRSTKPGGYVWVADPNHPWRINSLTYDAGAREFLPYVGWLQADGTTYDFDHIGYGAKTALFDWNLVGQRYQEMLAGTVGDGVFPSLRIYQKVVDPTTGVVVVAGCSSDEGGSATDTPSGSTAAPATDAPTTGFPPETQPIAERFIVDLAIIVDAGPEAFGEEAVGTVLSGAVVMVGAWASGPCQPGVPRSAARAACSVRSMRRSLLFVIVLLLVGADLVPIGSPPVAMAADTDVIINELHYNPVDDEPSSEFIEIFNRGPVTVDLSGWCFNGITYCFPFGSYIPSGAYVVRRAGEYTGALSNGGERIRLRNAASTIVDEVTYDDVGLWPAMADGEGPSLERRDPFGASNNPGNWIAGGPTPGAVNSNPGPALPVFSAVTHTVLPAPGQPIQVTAKLAGASSATIHYRVNFGAELAMPMTMAGSDASAAIPGQVAGALVRYRLVAYSPGGVPGTWPRLGDGANYTGTTVATTTTSKLPRFEWFMDDGTYAIAFNDLTLRGDDGYPMVLAYNGEIFDNTKIRVKGQVSRTFPKKKWKVILPPGYEFDIPGVFPEPVDEFALHSAWSDKSFLRETLASEFMTKAGVPVSQAFPVRLERNGSFYGLYTYSEQPDGSWRGRSGLDDAIVYEAGPDNIFGSLAAGDANLSQTNLRKKYDRETSEHLNDDELRDLIRTLNSLTGTARRQWIYDNVDVPSVVNTIAAAAVIQHQDIGHKNYRLVYTEFGRWQTIPSDFDLTYGRRWSNVYGALDSAVYVGGAFEHPGGPLFGAFWLDPELSAMIRRRIRTLTEQHLEPLANSARVAELRDLVAEEAALDRAVWGTYGASQSPAAAANQIISNYVAPQYARILGTLANSGRVASPTQPTIPAVTFSGVKYPTESDPSEYVAIRNDSGNTVDLSLFTIEALDLVIPGGTVLLPGQNVVFTNESIEWLGGAFRPHLVGGLYDGSLDGLDEGLRLRNIQGDVVAVHNLLPPGTQTEISGLANRSAVLSLVATQSGGSGYLQVLPCGDTAGTTANLNVDGVGRTVSGLAVVRFDGDGKVCVFNKSATHVVVDLQGYLVEGSFDDVVDARLLDTRGGAKPAAGSQTEISGLANRSAVVSVVATQSAGAGYLQVLPCGATPGATANVNVDGAGRTVSGLAVVRFDANGKVCVFNQSSTHIVVDLQGYLVEGSFDDVVDERLLDTRGGARPAEGTQTEISGLANRSAVVLLVATQTGGRGYLQVLPCGATPGATANVNFDGAGRTVSGLAVVRFDGSGKVCVFNKSAAHLVVDLQGYFVEGSFDDVVDERLLDTRNR